MDNKNEIFKVHYAKSFEHLQTVTNMIQTHSSSSVRPLKLLLAKAVNEKHYTVTHTSHRVSLLP